jgi:CDP-diacylglycerol--glycerol-3-phosphate 3-phosphatidyltransferase/cardiolipin synthase
MNLPTALTYARIAAIPVCFLFWAGLGAKAYPFLFVVFLAAAGTDWLDGYLARRLDAATPFGAMLDQIADKLLVAAFLLMLVYDRLLPASLAAIFILRDLFISGLREYLALQSIPLPVSRGGKWKTALQLAGIALVLAYGWAASSGEPIREVWYAGMATLTLAAVFALSSAWGYVRRVG